MSRVFFVFLSSVFLLAIGCQQESPQLAPAAPRLAASKLTILVIDDSPLATGIKLLRGEWAERSGGVLEIQERTVDQLLAATELSADLVIFPSRHLGTLVDRDWLRTVRKSVLQSEDVAIDDMYSSIRNATLPYGDQVYALSLGEPPLMLVGPFEKNSAEKISTWERLEFRLSPANSPLEYPRAAELLVRGTAYAQHRSRQSGWFDLETMEPQLAGQPFVRALVQILDNEKSTTKQTGPLLSLSWPTATRADSIEPINFVPLPRTEQVFNSLREIWVKREEGEPIAFYGFAGRSVGVTRSTRNSASAFKLLKWLVSESIATQLSPRSEATAWFRKSQAAKSKRWLSKSGARDETAAAVSKLLSSNNPTLLPRILGIDDYLQALEAAIVRAISTEVPPEVSPEDALAEVVEQWNILTDRYGRDRQRQVYRKHLGLERNDR